MNNGSAVMENWVLGAMQVRVSVAVKIANESIIALCDAGGKGGRYFTRGGDRLLSDKCDISRGAHVPVGTLSDISPA